MNTALADGSGGPKPLPWAAEPAVATQAGLTVRADKQLVGEYRRELSGFRFEVENTTDQLKTFEAKAIEVLSARLDWPPARPGEVLDRKPEVLELLIRGCWYEDEAHQIHVVRDKGRGPVSVQVSPKATLMVMLRFSPIMRTGGRSYWRRLTFAVGAAPLQVTGPIVPIGFSPDTIQGELRR